MFIQPSNRGKTQTVPSGLEVGEGGWGGVFETKIQTNTKKKKTSVAAQPVLRGECDVNNLSCGGSDT